MDLLVEAIWILYALDGRIEFSCYKCSFTDEQ